MHPTEVLRQRVSLPPYLVWQVERQLTKAIQTQRPQGLTTAKAQNKGHLSEVALILFNTLVHIGKVDIPFFTFRLFKSHTEI